MSFVYCVVKFIELKTIDLLSPSTYLDPITPTPKYLSVYLRSIYFSTRIYAATNSETYVASSEVACLFEKPINRDFIKKI